MLKRWLCRSLGVITLSSLGTIATADQEYRISIGLYKASALSSTRIERVVGKVSEIFRSGCTDVTAVLKNSGKYASQLGTDFDSKVEASSNKFKASPFTIHVVKSISFCAKPSVNGNILGCAFQGGPIAVRKRANAASDAQVWAHELGHSQGLNSSFAGYVKGHNPNFGSLMYASASLSNTALDQSECKVLRKPQKVKAGSEASTSPDHGHNLQPEQIEAYFESEWIHGLDPTIIDAFPEEFQSLAAEALQENIYRRWPNAALVAGYLAIPQALELLDKVVSFENQDVAEEDAFYIDEAKPNAVLAYGYLIVQNGQNTDGRILSRLNPNNIVDPLVSKGDLDDLLEHNKAIARSANISLALAAAISKVAEDRLEEQRQAQEKGAFDLGVSEDFFPSLESFVEDVRNNGLSNALEISLP